MPRGGQEEKGGGGGRGRSYLSTERCRRGSARGPRLRLGCSTRARRRRPGFCSCCGPRRLLEGSGAVSAGDRRPQHPAPPPDNPHRRLPGLPPRLPGPTCRERGAGVAPHRQPVEARGASGGHSPVSAVGRAVAAEALCGETRPSRAGVPGSPGRSPAPSPHHPPPPPPPPPRRDRPLSPTTKPSRGGGRRAGRHSPSAPRAAASSSEPSSTAPNAADRRGPPRSILGAEGEEPPPARPRSSARLRSAPRRDLPRLSPPR